MAQESKKSLFWQECKSVVLNERQIKIINMLWDGFDGKLNTSKWAKTANTSPATALRDIQDLVEKGILCKTAEAGRSTNYELAEKYRHYVEAGSETSEAAEREAAAQEEQSAAPVSLFDELNKDYRFREGFHTCINCGTCTAVCPAAEFYCYDPRQIVFIVQTKDNEKIEELLKSDKIWYCGECMSCVTRCPRKNGPGLVIMALRDLSIRLGYFVESEKGRQMLPLTHALTGNILNYGYCVYPRSFKWEDHKESGPVFKWHLEHLEKSMQRLGANFEGDGPGVLRKIPQKALDELKAIFDVTGGTERIKHVEEWSKKKAEEMGMTLEAYEKMAFEYCSNKHFNL